MKCQGCGVEKDLDKLEIYPYQEEDAICDSPISPIMEIECQGEADRSVFKWVKVCHECFHKLSPDMWISERGWKSINPVIAFDDLPKEEDESGTAS